MSQRDPWSRDSEPPREPSRFGLLLWIALLAAMGLAVWKLSEWFPGALDEDVDQATLIWRFAVLALVAAGVISLRKERLGTVARNAAIWLAIGGVLALGYVYRDELNDAGVRVRMALVPGYGVTGEGGETVLSAAADGHFHVIGEANGQPVQFLIDTGASDTVLSPADARRLGIQTASLDFDRTYMTANGVGRGARYVLDRLTIGSRSFDRVEVSINEAEMDQSLLGVGFLRDLASVEIRGDRMTLRWK